MKLNWSHLESVRKTDGEMASPEGAHFGAFFFQRVNAEFVAVASNGSNDVPWEHVSVRARDYKGGRTPTWDEMCWIKKLFWDEEECVVQYHPPKSEYVNNHPHVLHLWKPIIDLMPRPPSIAVGIK